MKIRLEASESGDWKRLYVDGKLLAEGHSFENVWPNLLRALGYDVEAVELPDEDFE